MNLEIGQLIPKIRERERDPDKSNFHRITISNPYNSFIP